MDLAFSLDNVVAAVSLSDQLWVVILGVAIGILAMRFAAGIFSYLVVREPVLQQAAYILVFNIGVMLLIEEFGGIEIADWFRFAISASTILLALAYEHIPFMKVLRPLLLWLGQGFGIMNELVNWLFLPFKALFSLLWQALRPIFARPARARS
jgi:tellurite resistance protein TerC